MRFFLILSFVCALFVSAAAHAVPKSTAQIGEFATMPGYGYRIAASWDDSYGGLELMVEAADSTSVWTDGQRYGFAKLSASLHPIDANFGKGLKSFDLSVGIQIELINLGENTQAIPPLTSNPNVPVFATRVLPFSGIQLAGDPDFQFRISRGEFTKTTDVDYPLIPNPTEFSFLESVRFVAGNYAALSDDPSCASVLCMPVRADALSINPIGFSVEIAAIPEPSTFWILSVGVVVLVGRALRANGFSSRNMPL